VTFFQWFCAGFGVAAGFVVVGIVIFDCYLTLRGQPTISKHIADATHNYPIIAATMGLVAGFILGALTGHLFFPENP
jgi:hypothetical protein